MPRRLTLKSIEPVTHDVHHLVFDRPEDYRFTPGQATELRLDQDGWQDEARPFSFVSLPEDPTLDFMIKSYSDRDGVTRRIAQLQPGDAVLIGDPWGAIADRGPGMFIAGGAGITPFVSILRRRARDRDGLNGCTLIFSNRREEDIILRDEWQAMPSLSKVFTLTQEDAEGLHRRRIDRDFLEEVVHEREQHFYVCGPRQMVRDVSAALAELGVRKDRVVVEDL